MGLFLRPVSSHLLTLFQFVSFPVATCHIRVARCGLAIFVLISWWGRTSQSQLNVHILFLFWGDINHYVLDLNAEAVRASWNFQPRRLRVSHNVLLYSLAVLTTWQKPSNQSRGLQLISCSNAVQFLFNSTSTFVSFNAKAILLEEQQWHYLTRNWGISGFILSPKVFDRKYED